MGSPSKPVTLPDGTEFPSMAACARALNISRSWVWMAIRHGRMDWLECGEDDNGNRRGRRSKPRPVTIDGVEYQSIHAAAKVVGIPRSTLYSMYFPKRGIDRD